jgi:hypothetical protein
MTARQERVLSDQNGTKRPKRSVENGGRSGGGVMCSGWTVLAYLGLRIGPVMATWSRCESLLRPDKGSRDKVGSECQWTGDATG